jgi:hypothetical protein
MAGEQGYTRRDPDQHSGFTRRDPNEHAGYTRREDDPQTSGGFYNPSNNSPYDDHSGYTRRYGANNDGYTRRDPNQHTGYTRRGHGGTHSPSDLKNAEENGQSKSSRLKDLAANGLSGVLNSEKQGSGGNGDAPFNYINNGPRFGKARGFLEKHRKKVIAGSLAGIGVLPLLALLMFLLGALKIPHFVENVAAWRFAKVTNQYRKTMNNVISEKNAIDSLDDAARDQAKAKYGKYAVFDKVNRLRPNKVIQSLNASDRIQYHYKKTLTGKQKLVSITIAPDENPRTKINVKVPTGRFDRLIHPFRTLDQYKTISDALNSAMKAHDPKIPALTRALATRAVLQKAGATLKGMTASKYLGKSDRDAKIAITQEAYEKSHKNGGIEAITNENTREVAQEASDEADKAVADKDQVGEMVDKGQEVPESVNNVIERGLNPGNLKAIAEKVVGFANPIYDIAVPICMAYDGSKLTPEGVDAQHDSMVSEAAFVLSTGDQQKAGAFNTAAAGAMNWKLGNVQDSNAIRRVSGKPVNSLDTLGGQRTAMGTYGTTTIFDVFHLSALNGPADDLCPTLTNIWVGIGIGVVNIAILVAGSIFTGGASGAAQISASAAAKKLAEETLTKTVKKVITTATKKTIKSFAGGGRFAKAYTKSVVKYGAATAAAVFLAQMIVNNYAGLNSSGLEKGVAFADNVDNGAEMLSSDINKANYYARPLNNVEVVQSHRIDRAEMAYNNQQLSTFERYLAFENPNSMVSRMAITTGSLLDRSMFASMLNSLANLFNPVGLSSKMFAGLNATTTLAAGNVNTEDYGNVVWAYSQEEQRLMEQDSYASPSENSHRLEESGKEDEINSKYAKCYENSIGTLLTSGDITRDEDGDVLNSGDCSPEQLGAHNPEFGDLVFRWRLKHAYENTTDTLLGIQDPSAATSNNNSGNLGGIPTGTAQQLAQQILNNGNLSFQTDPSRQAMQHIASTGKARNCGAPAVSPKLLGVVLAAASKYKIVLGVLTDGHDCDGGFHPMGAAIDINGVNALDGSDGTGRFITQANYNSSKILRSFYTDIGNLIGQAGGGGMGQFDCFAQPLPSKNSNVNYFNGDTCNHLHIDVGKR